MAFHKHVSISKGTLIRKISLVEPVRTCFEQMISICFTMVWSLACLLYFYGKSTCYILYFLITHHHHTPQECSRAGYSVGKVVAFLDMYSTPQTRLRTCIHASVARPNGNRQPRHKTRNRCFCARTYALADFGLSYAHEKNYTDGISLWTFGLAVIRLGF